MPHPICTTFCTTYSVLGFAQTKPTCTLPVVNPRLRTLGSARRSSWVPFPASQTAGPRSVAQARPGLNWPSTGPGRIRESTLWLHGVFRDLGHRRGTSCVDPAHCLGRFALGLFASAWMGRAGIPIQQRPTGPRSLGLGGPFGPAFSPVGVDYPPAVRRPPRQRCFLREAWYAGWFGFNWLARLFALGLCCGFS